MEEMNECKITRHPDKISYESNKKISEQMEKNICKKK